MWNKLDRAIIGLLDHLLELRMMPVFFMALGFIVIVAVVAVIGKVIGD